MSAVKTHPQIIVATAAWSIPREAWDFFPLTGSHLERYAKKLNGVEINSSFYRNHQAKTYERWRDTVPDGFRFSVKLAKVFTHEQKMQKGTEDLGATLRDVLKLGDKLSVLLVQTPPSLKLFPPTAEHFFANLRTYYTGAVAFEPRHNSWNSETAANILAKWHISRVIADPQPISNLAPHPSLAYYRLHGSPHMYKSNYNSHRLKAYAKELKSQTEKIKNVWCVFDNTTYGHATLNALWLHNHLNSPPDLFKESPVHA